MRRKEERRFLAEEENGGAMVFGALGMILIIMFMALMMDLGLYYSSYRRLKSASDFANDEIQQMLTYYSYSDDYMEAFHNSLNSSLSYLGYSADNIKKSEISRRQYIDMHWVIEVDTDIQLNDTYHCLFASIIGINEIPVHVISKKSRLMSIDEPYYSGRPVEVWGGEERESGGA